MCGLFWLTRSWKNEFCLEYENARKSTSISQHSTEWGQDNRLNFQAPADSSPKGQNWQRWQTGELNGVCCLGN